MNTTISNIFVFVIDIWQVICDYCDTITQLNLISTCNLFRSELCIKNLTDPEITYMLNDDILKQHIYRNLLLLDLTNNQKVTDIRHLTKLNLLNTKTLDQTNINNMSLINLSAAGNKLITDVSHMKKTLKALDCYGNCGITYINDLKLTNLDVSGNSKIIDISNMIDTLKVLKCGYADGGLDNEGYIKCNIDQSCLIGMNLIELYTSMNDAIYDVSHMSHTLKVLNCNCNGWFEDNKSWKGIGQECINKLQLIELYASNNCKINNVSHMATLTILDCSDGSEINQDSLDKLNLIKLIARDNDKVNNVNHMTKLKILDCSGDCAINQDGIQNINLAELIISGNQRISNISHMSNLKKLTACGSWYRRYDTNVDININIDQNGINGLNLTELDISDNDKIIDIDRKSVV